MVPLHFSTFLPVIFDNVVWNWYLKPHVNQLNETHEFSPSAACVVSILYWRRSFSRLKLDWLEKTDGGQSYIESQRVLIYDKFPPLVVFVVSTRSVSAACWPQKIGRSVQATEWKSMPRTGWTAWEIRVSFLLVKHSSSQQNGEKSMKFLFSIR